MLDVVIQAEPHQYRDQERGHGHAHEQPPLDPLSLGHFVCNGFVEHIHLRWFQLEIIFGVARHDLALIWIKGPVSRCASSRVSNLAADNLPGSSS
jgi:hypothetical protein